jgi:hypothetical protein
VKGHDTEIEILTSRLASLEKQHVAAESHTTKLKQVRARGPSHDDRHP